MAIAMRGLRVRPQYEDLIGVAFPYGLEQLNSLIEMPFLRNGFILSQLDGEGMRVMEQQQQRHMKEVYTDSAFKPLASNLDNESISNSSFKNAYTQDLQTQRIKEIITRANNSRKANDNAEYYELSPGDDMEPPLEVDSASSSASGQEPIDLTNYIHVEGYMGSIRNLENDHRLKELENQQRMQEIFENNKIMLKTELHEMSGEKDIQITKLRNVIDDLVHNNTPPPYVYNEARQPPVHTDTVLNQHLQSVEMSQRSRQQHAPSSNNPEPAHEPKGAAARPRNHGVPTETRKDPLWWNPQPTGFYHYTVTKYGVESASF